jgi:hypothetical protein
MLRKQNTSKLNDTTTVMQSTSARSDNSYGNVITHNRHRVGVGLLPSEWYFWRVRAFM